MKLLASILLLTISISGFAQIGNNFPNMETETLNEQALMLPSDIGGKFSIIGMAYSKKSEEDLNTWFGPAYSTFIEEPDKMDLFATDYDVNLYFVPMLTGHKTVAYKKVMNKVKETTNPELYPHVLFYKGSLNEYKEALRMDDKKLPYFFLVNPEGKIVWKTSGAYNQAKMQTLIDKLDEFLGEWE